MDNESKGYACQQDARNYCDALRANRVVRWLRGETASSDEATALLKAGSAFAALSARAVGMHAGPRNAGADGRVPALDAASQRIPFWQPLGFEGTGLASFADSPLAAFHGPAAAIRIQDDCTEHLSQRWNLQMRGGLLGTPHLQGRA